MKKAPLFAIAAAALFIGGAGPALAHDNTSFSFGIVVGDGGHHRGPSRHYRDDDCDRDRGYRRSYYGRPYYYGPPERVVIIDRRDRHHYHRDWDDRGRHGRDWND